MNKNYHIEFSNEVERILKELYYNPLPNIPTEKRAIIETEKRHVDYLITYDLVSKVKVNIGGTSYPLSLNKKGYEVFEKYTGWNDYKKQVIDKQDKIEKSKALAQRYWWLPILISLLALGVAVFALFTND